MLRSNFNVIVIKGQYTKMVGGTFEFREMQSASWTNTTQVTKWKFLPFWDGIEWSNFWKAPVFGQFQILRPSLATLW